MIRNDIVKLDEFKQLPINEQLEYYHYLSREVKNAEFLLPFGQYDLCCDISCNTLQYTLRQRLLPYENAILNSGATLPVLEVLHWLNHLEECDRGMLVALINKDDLAKLNEEADLLFTPPMRDCLGGYCIRRAIKKTIK